MRVRMSLGAVVWGVLLVGSAFWRGLRGAGLWQELIPLLAVTLAAALHEGGHLLAARAVGVQVRGMRLDVFGARMALGGCLSYGQEWLVALGGPLVNALTGGIALLARREWGRDPWGGLLLFGAASLILCGVNLLPVATLDGGRMLACGLALGPGERVSAVTLQVLTALTLGGVWLVAVYALLRAESLLSLFVFSLCLLLRSMGGGGVSP